MEMFQEKRSALNVDHWLTSAIFLFEIASLPGLELTRDPVLGNQPAPGTPGVWFPSIKIINMCYHTWLLYVVLGIELRSLCGKYFNN